MKIKILILLIISILIGLIIACEKEEPVETTGNLTGKVTEDGSNKAIEAAEVTVSGVSQTYKTGSDGKYEVTDLEEGNYTITVSKAGYKSNNKQLTVQAGKTTTGDFSLELEVPELVVNPPKLDFANDANQMTFAICNSNDKTDMEWLIEIPNGADWVSVSKKSGTLKTEEETITVSIDRDKMTGNKGYNANLVVKSTNGGGSATVLVLATKEVPKIEVNPKVLDFSNNIEQMYITIGNTNSNSELEWEIEIPQNIDWISVSKQNGKLSSGTETVNVFIDRSKLTEAKTYTTSLTVKSTNEGGSETVNISAEKLGAKLYAEPILINFGETETEKSILLRNSTHVGIINYSATPTENWITVEENASGTISGADVKTLRIAVSRDGLATNTYTGKIVISSDANNIDIDVAMKVQPKAKVTTYDTENITFNKATAHGRIEDLGTGSIDDHGFCYSTTSAEPDIEDSKKSLGSTISTGKFSSKLTELEADTKYYIRAYATNSAGTEYGTTLEFTTKEEPVVTGGLVAYYTFDNENCDVYYGDEKYNGITTATPSYSTDIPGGIGKSLECEWGKRYKSPCPINESCDNYTYSVWIKLDHRKCGNVYNCGDNRIKLNLNEDYGNTIKLIYTYNSDDPSKTNLIEFNAQYGSWHHLVIVRTPTYRHFYVDGYQKYSGAAYSKLSETHFIGGSDQGGNPSKIDNLRIYNRALSKAEVNEIYNAKQ